MLREFPGQALKPDERTDRLGPHHADQVVERGLPACVPFQLGSPEDLHREQIRLSRQDLGDDRPKRLCLRRPANRPPLSFFGIVDMGDVGFTFDPPDRPDADADEAADVGLVVSRVAEYFGLRAA